MRITTRATTRYDRECAECHVNGFDLTRRVVGPDTLYIAGWVGRGEGDSALQDQNIKIGCETCHGPGSDHVANPTAPGSIFNPNDLPRTQEGWQLRLDACNFCHARTRSTQETFRYPYDEAGNRPYVPGQPLSGFVNDMFRHMNNWPDGRTSYAHRQMGQDYLRGEAHHEALPNSCYDCHSVHTQGAPDMPYQLKENYYSLADGEGCVSCHGSAGPTMNPPLENMLLTSVRNGRTVNAHTQHSPGVSQCVNCHMTKTASIAFVELPRKPLYEFSDHSFRVIRPSLTRDYQGSLIGNINTCAASCHRNGRGSRNFADTTPRAPDFGITDPHLGTWKEPTDVELADSLWYHYQQMFARFVNAVRTGDEVTGASAITGIVPMPMSVSATVQFAVARAGDVTVEVYDLAGNRRRTLAAGRHQPGTYAAGWDGHDELGTPVRSGNYLVRLRTPTGSSSRIVQVVR